VPTELVRDVALVGTPQDVRAQAAAWRGTVVTTLLVQAAPEQLPTIAGLLADV
jgi:hypothetical protein